MMYLFFKVMIFHGYMLNNQRVHLLYIEETSKQL